MRLRYAAALAAVVAVPVGALVAVGDAMATATPYTPICEPGDYWSPVGCMPLSRIAEAYEEMVPVSTEDPSPIGKAWAAVSEWAPVGAPRNLYLVPNGVESEAACTASGHVGLYCENDVSIYMGQTPIDAWTDVDPVMAFYVIAHEYGHHVQQVEQTVNHGSWGELHAECISGAFVGWAQDQGVLTAADAELIHRMVASSGGGGEYGTHAERDEAFGAGYEGADIGACEHLL